MISNLSGMHSLVEGANEKLRDEMEVASGMDVGF